jgi:hypothetical protein
MNLQKQEQPGHRAGKIQMNSSNLNNPYTARVGDSPLFSDAAVCTEDLNNPYTAV